MGENSPTGLADEVQEFAQLPLEATAAIQGDTTHGVQTLAARREQAVASPPCQNQGWFRYGRPLLSFCNDTVPR